MNSSTFSDKKMISPTSDKTIKNPFKTVANTEST